MKKADIFSLVCAFLGGVFLQNTLFSLPLSLFFVGLWWILVLNAFIYKKIQATLVFLIPVCLFAWVLWTSFFTLESQKKEQYIERYFLESQLDLVYRVEDIYKKKEFDIDYIVQIVSIAWEDIREQKLFGIIRAPRNYSLLPWQIWSSKTQLYPVSKQDDAFKYFFFSRGIYFRAYPYEFSFWSSEELFLSFLYPLREKFIGKVTSLYPQDAASLLNGILIWERWDISQKLNDDFTRSGLTHIVAVSGFNITILILFSRVIFWFLPWVLQVIWVGLTTLFFVLLVWPSMSVLRAAIMWIIWYLVLFWWRKVDILSTLIVSWAIIVIFSPLSLNYDISLQLSFLATLWIVLFSKPFMSVLSRFPKMLFVQEGIVITFCALILTVPILLWNFWQLSLIAPISNLLVVWNIPYIMLFWFLSLVLSFIYTPISLFFTYLAFLFLKYDIEVAHFFWSQPWSVFEFDMGEWKYLFMFGYYLCIFWLYKAFRLLQK